ncbi:hypothetical protein H2200_003991 [Cladophialophora chaetospira]|uniref:Uncharacterized protein n=1 Tax=Cladophialophora chaetospira TaxID=386627 RepID=A0AA39CKH2_9EURO|nr:hypothetical protein H2200_003991 [Cladophialophora chaetospira]
MTTSPNQKKPKKIEMGESSEESLEPHQAHDEPAHEEQPNNIDTSLDKKHKELADQAVTFKLTKIDTPDNKVHLYPEVAVESHYVKSKSCKFEPGELYRVWYRINVEVHLSTFLILKIKGSDMTCLKILHRDPKEGGMTKFERSHGRLKAKEYVQGHRHFPRRASSQLRAQAKNEKIKDADGSDAFVVDMETLQGMKENCWIDLCNPWNIDWQRPYRFAYCGRLQDDSFDRVIEIHTDLYLENLKTTT